MLKTRAGAICAVPHKRHGSYVANRILGIIPISIHWRTTVIHSRLGKDLASVTSTTNVTVTVGTTKIAVADSFSPLCHAFQALVVTIQSLVHIAPHFMNCSHFAISDTPCQKIFNWRFGFTVFTGCTENDGSIVQGQFVDLHSFFEFSSLDLDTSEHIEKDSKTRMVSTQVVASNAIGNRVHFQSLNEFTIVFILDAHFDNICRIIVRRKDMMSIVHQPDCLGNCWMVVWVFGLFKDVESLQITLDCILISKVNVFRPPCFA
mmetsp:Transcript_6697/g.10466  ORF Transcript_6697/g.10466 Transcript_6697/m.10466 type:complete len:262 (+) Transcript_6697:1893-2678(+)